MGIPTANTAAIPAISMPGSREVSPMNEEQFRNEMLYQTTMHVMRRMLRQGMASLEEYRQIDTIFTRKYQPVFGTLLVGNDLLL